MSKLPFVCAAIAICVAFSGPSAAQGIYQAPSTYPGTPGLSTGTKPMVPRPRHTRPTWKGEVVRAGATQIQAIVFTGQNRPQPTDTGRTTDQSPRRTARSPANQIARILPFMEERLMDPTGRFAMAIRWINSDLVMQQSLAPAMATTPTVNDSVNIFRENGHRYVQSPV